MRSLLTKVELILRYRRGASALNRFLGDRIVSRKERPTDVKRAIAASLRVADPSSFLLPDGFSRPPLPSKFNGRSEREQRLFLVERPG
jgi:hypothetical protein